MATTIESLELEIKSSSQSATKGIDELSSSLKRLREATKGGVGLSSVTREVKELNTALRSMNTSAIEKIATLTKSINGLSAIGNVNSQLQSFSKTLASSTKEITSMATQIQSLTKEMQSLTETTEESDESNKKSTKNYTNLLSRLLVLRKSMQSVGYAIRDCVKLSNTYIEDLNLFSVTMGEFASEAAEYADTVSELMGIDPAEWMREQGIFNTVISGFGVATDRAYTMSQQLTQLGYDISSFFNITVDEAMTKLQSGISGELEPLRQLGYDLSQARLEAVALSLGIDQTFSSMTQAEKAQLRYYAIMSQVTVAQGDMARTLKDPANQLRVLQAQVTQLGRSFGNLFIPALTATLPYLISFAKVVRKVIQSIAEVFNIEIPDVDFSGLSTSTSSVADSTEDIEDGLSGATGEAKKLKSLMTGIDELNILSQSDSSTGSGSTSTGVGTTGDPFDFELPTYDFIGDAVSTQIDEISEKIKTLLPVIAGVGGAFAAWVGLEKLGNFLQLTDAAGLASHFKVLGGAILVAAGMVLYFKGAIESLSDGMNAVNLTEMLAGLAGIAGGLYLAISPFNKILAPVASGFALVAGGAGILAISLKDVSKNGATVANIVGSITGAVSVVGGLYLVTRRLASPLSAIATPLAGVVMSLVTLNTYIPNLINNGATAENVLGVVAGAVGLVTSAVLLCTAAMNVNPLFGVFTIATTIVTSIVAIGNAIEKAGKQAYESTDDFKIMQDIIASSEEITSRCADAMGRLESNVSDLDSVSADFAAASALVNEIFEINEKAELTAYDMELIKTKVSTLNSMGLDGLQLTIDETTGRVVETKKAIEDVIKALEKQARTAALQEMLVQAYKDQYQAAKDTETALSNVEVATDKLKRTTQLLSETPWYDVQTRSRLKTAQEQETEALEKALEAYGTALETYDGMSEAIENYTTELGNMETAESTAGDPLCETMYNAKETFKKVSGDIIELGVNLAEGLKEGVNGNIKEDDFHEAWSKIPFSAIDFFDIHSPSRVMKTYGSYIAEGLREGVDENTKEKSYTSIWDRLTSWFKKSTTDQMNVDVKVILKKSGWTSVLKFIGDIPTLKQAISLTKSGWTSVKAWIGSLSALTQKISLGKSGWTSVKDWVGTPTAITQKITLGKSGWKSVKDWIGDLQNLSQKIGLARTGWTDVSKWVKDNYLGSGVNVKVSLTKNWQGTFLNFLGLKDGGIVTVSGITQMQRGGIATSRGVSLWDSIPKYANGTANAGARGSLFVAGESGAELVGHVNGQTEVMNRFQLASVMHSAIVSGMSNFTGYWTGINAKLTTCANAVIQASLVGTNAMVASVDRASTNYEAYAVSAYQAENSRYSQDSQDSEEMLKVMGEFYRKYVEGTLTKIASDTERQANKAEKTIVQVGNRTVRDAVITQQKADGYSFTT